ncbi:MAG: tetratricopeptide repeat protein [Candidatus Hydrogenedentes bacterium]|nr:tetratricopeptide repeat protein [Candidatus Hydrogenedentota bacterium]
MICSPAPLILVAAVLLFLAWFVRLINSEKWGLWLIILEMGMTLSAFLLLIVAYRRLNALKTNAEEFRRWIETQQPKERRRPSPPTRRQRKDTQAAIDWFSEQISRDPNQYKPYVLRGGGYAVLQDYERALEDLSIAISLNPAPDNAAYYAKSQVLFDCGRIDEGIRVCEHAIELSTRQAIIYEILAKALYTKQDYQKAWSVVEAYQQTGGQTPLDANFVEELRKQVSAT